MMAKMACPICGQDWIYPIRIKGTDHSFFTCGDSEETWMRVEDIGPGIFSNNAEQGTYTYLDRAMMDFGLTISKEGYDQLEWGDPNCFPE